MAKLANAVGMANDVHQSRASPTASGTTAKLRPTTAITPTTHRVSAATAAPAACLHRSFTCTRMPVWQEGRSALRCGGSSVGLFTSL